ncbi:MAG: AraC family transcriptional regulator [Burkholderiaceae bacterium]|nr:AraC family transcriptional regulator [Burkholderiaceae bacterium]
MSASVTSHTIAIPQVLQILQGVKHRGMDVPAILLRAGIAPELLDSPLSRVTQAQYAALILVLRRVTRDELWGLCRHPVRVGSFAQVCQLLVHCRTLGEALRTAFRFYHLLLEDFVPRLHVSGPTARITMVTRGERDELLAYAERSFCFLGYGVVSWLVSRRIPLTWVFYPVEGQSQGSEGGRLFQAPVRHDSPYMGFEFEARWLDLPVVQSSQSLQDFFRDAPASLLVKYRDQTRLSERIRRLLRRHLRGEMPSLEVVSASMAMTPQTLRRRLREEGQGFQAIKDDLRRDAAIEYLGQPNLTLLDIANRLGFSEASTFHRAFKGWTGQSPGVYRQTRWGVPGA